MLMGARGLLALLLVALVATAAATPAPSMADEGPTTLSALPGGDYMAVDDVNQHVFVTGLPPAAPFDTNQTVEVLNFDGTVDTTLTVPGAEGMTIAKGNLYVAGCGSPTITVFDLATLTQTGTITLQENMGYPCALATTAGRLLFDADTGNGFSNPAYIQFNAPTTEVEWSDAGTASPAFAVSPTVAKRVVTTSLDGTPAVDEVWNVGPDPPTQLGSAADIGVGAPADSAAITPDGANLFVTDGTSVQEYALPALSTHVETLSNRPSATRIAVNADASFMAAGLALAGGAPGVDIFNATRTTPIHWITLAGATGSVRALAFSADSSKLFVVTQPDSGPPQFFVVDSPTLAASLLSLGATPMSVSPGQTVQLQGILTLQDAAPASGATVDISETRPDGSTADLGPVTVGSGGVYTMPTEELSQIGTYTFTATYAGDSTHLGSTASTTVAVARGVTTLSLHGSATHVVYGHTVTLTAKLTGAPSGSVVTITRDVNGAKSVVTNGRVNADGIVTVTVKPGQRTIYSARFAGSAGFFPSSSGTVTVTVSPVLGGSLSKPYATQSGYKLYHYRASCATSATSCPVFTETFTPANPGHLVYVIVQQHTSNGWNKVAEWSGTLGPQSKAAIKIRYTKTSVIGPAFRLLAHFPAGPTFAGANKGYWYFKITH